MSKLFFAGVPTKLDVDAIMKAITPASGLNVPYEAIEKIVSVKSDTDRFRTVTTAWRKKVFREFGLESIAQAGQFRFLTAEEALDQNIKALHRIGKATGRLSVRAAMIKVTELPENRTTQHALLNRETSRLLETTRSVVKEIAAPKPVQHVGRIAAQ